MSILLSLHQMQQTPVALLETPLVWDHAAKQRDISFYVHDPSKVNGSLNLQDLRHLMLSDMPADFFLTISELVKKAGFHFEEHDVQTKDGYILGMMRVMNDDVKAGAKRPAIFMQHGILSSADTWTSHYPTVAPAF